jgi:hypothetical protein
MDHEAGLAAFDLIDEHPVGEREKKRPFHQHLAC